MARGRSAATVEGLRGLEAHSPGQIEYALRLVAEARYRETLEPALEVLDVTEDPRIRPALLARYAWCGEDPARRDSGCYLRMALLRALRRFLRLEDLPLLEKATRTYEYTPPYDPLARADAALGLRSHGLAALDLLDPTLAAYHAVYLLTDPRTSEMSGEPALTAAGVLAGHGQLLPLYSYAVGEGPKVSEVLGECLRSLVELPDLLLPELIERHEGSIDEVALLGLFDLLLAHRSRAVADAGLLRFLRATRLYGVYRFVVHAIFSSRQQPLIEAVRALVPQERDPAKREVLEEALALRRGGRD